MGFLFKCQRSEDLVLTGTMDQKSTKWVLRASSHPVCQSFNLKFSDLLLSLFSFLSCHRLCCLGQRWLWPASLTYSTLLKISYLYFFISTAVGWLSEGAALKVAYFATVQIISLSTAAQQEARVNLYISPG